MVEMAAVAVGAVGRVGSAVCCPRFPQRSQPTITGLMIDPERLAGARGNTFLATVGEKLHLLRIRTVLHQDQSLRLSRTID